MAEWNITSPLLNEMQILDCLSETGGVHTYLVQNQISEKKYIFKSISIPESQTHVDGLKYSGAIQTAGEAQAYYEKVVADYKNEIDTLTRLSECGTIDGYRACHIQPKEDAVGFDLHVLSACRKTLAEFMEETPMTHLKAAELMMDLCASLTDLRQAGYIHCNIKPENIYLNKQGHFMVGDLGLFRADQLKYAAVPERMLGKFSAPELFDVMKTPNTTVDIYTIGLILYSIYNGGHNIFEDERTGPKGASEQRLSGAELPAPLYADYEMTEILKKACAFAPEDRYQTPEEFRDVLKDYIARNQPQDDLIVPPIVVDEDTQISEEAMNEEIEPVQFANAEELADEFVHHFSPDSETHQEIAETIQEEIAQEEAALLEKETAEESSEEEDVISDVEALLAEDAESQPPVEAESDTSEQPVQAEKAEKAPEKKKRKFPVALVCIIAAIVVIFGALAGAYFYFTPNVTEITALEAGTDYFVLSLDSNKPLSEIQATCVDTYGNVTPASEKDGTLLFEGLNPGTQYTVQLKSQQGYLVRGLSSAMISTNAATDVLFFDAKPVSESQVELNFSIAGQDQDTWTVEYGADGQDKKVAAFTGHNTLISDLEPNTVYTFTLKSDTIALTGNYEIQYDTTVKVKDLKVNIETTENTASVSWTFEGDAPTAWTVILRNADGATEKQSVTEASVLFEELDQNQVYTVEIFCSGMAASVQRLLKPGMVSVSDLSVSVNDEGQPVLSWTSSEELSEGWPVLCRMVDHPEIFTEIHSDETTAALIGLLPSSKYSATVQSAAGTTVNGEATVEIDSGEAENFSDYGASSTYMGLYLAPESENWNYRSLATAKTEFSGEQRLAFALQCMSKLESSEDEVSVTVVVRNSEKAIYSAETYTAVWNTLWENDLFVGALEEMPTEAGKYTIEIYFNGSFANSAAFTVL